MSLGSLPERVFDIEKYLSQKIDAEKVEEDWLFCTSEEGFLPR